MKNLKIKLTSKNIFIELKKNYHLIILFGLLITGFIFAFNHFPFRYQLSDETIRDVAVAISGSRQLQLPLIGGFASTGPFTFGPWVYYQLILFSLVLPSYFAPFIYLGLIYVISILLLYRIGVELKDYRLGLILATLGTFSPAMIIGSTHLTSSNILTVFVLLATLLFIKIIKDKNISYWWGFTYGVVMGIAMNMNYQSINLLVLAVLMLIYKRRKIKYFLTFCVGVILTFIPLLLFDLNNHWMTVRNFTYYLQHGRDLVYVPNRWLFYVRDFWPALWGDVIGIPSLLAFITMCSVAALLLYQLYKRKLSIPIFLLAVAFFIEFVQMRYFWGQRYFGYFNFLRPFIFIFTGYLLYSIFKEMRYGKIIFTVIFIVCLVTILPKSVDRFKLDPIAVESFKQAKILESLYPNKKFTMFICKESYKSNNQDIPKSILFHLTKDNKISENGIPILIDKARCVGDDISVRKQPFNLMLNSNSPKYKEIPSTNIVVLPNVSTKVLGQAGWETQTFRKIHDNTTRWWFDEKP